MKWSALFLAAAGLSIFSCGASNANDTPTIFGLGMQSCGDYLDARRTDPSTESVAYLGWVGGYLSAVNLSTGRNVLQGTNMQGAMYWLDNYCHAHPTLIFVNAVMSFVTERAKPTGR